MNKKYHFLLFFKVQDGFSSERRARGALHLQVKADLNFQPIVVNPYLEHFGDFVERHLWTKNPQSYFYF